MIFSGIFEISGTENTAGGASTWPRGSRARLPASWAHGGSPPLIPAPTHSFFLPKKLVASSNPSSCSSCCHFRSPCSKLHSQNCFELGDRKWHQDELELVLEPDGDVFGRKKECVVAGISGEEPCGPTRQGRAQGVRVPSTLVARWMPPCCVLSAKYSQIFQKKSYLNFRGFGELLFSGYFYIARIIQKTDRNYYFCFI